MTGDIYRGITHVPAEEGQWVEIGPGTTIFKLASADTANTMAIWEGIVPPGFGSPPLHAHPESETFYLLDGELAFTGISQDGPYTFRAGPGATVHIPGGALFQFVNAGKIPARVLTITLPGGLDWYLTEFSALLPAGVSPDIAMGDPGVREKVAVLDARYGHWYAHPDGQTTPGTDKSIVFVPAGEGATFPMGRGTNTVKLTAADTAGAMSLIEGVLPPGAASVPLHTHPEAETFYLLEGEAEFTSIDEGRRYIFIVRQGDIVYVPPRTPHQFTIAGVEPARGIVIVTPGGIEHYMAELSAARRPDGSADMAELLAIAARYGVEYVDLPRR
jgi:mannose-6-phosphate isomerase-like protein (cupin superfamily)